jgi:predicted transcriptional regulator
MRELIDRDVVLTGNQQTSVLSAQKLMARAGSKRRKIYDLIKDAGLIGLCDHELEKITGLSHQTVSSSRCSLAKDGWINDSGARRITDYGNKAIVWIALS